MVNLQQLEKAWNLGWKVHQAAKYLEGQIRVQVACDAFLKQELM
jgi:hypothetical protein